jgi:hypothetical protein
MILDEILDDPWGRVKLICHDLWHPLDIDEMSDPRVGFQGANGDMDSPAAKVVLVKF